MRIRTKVIIPKIKNLRLARNRLANRILREPSARITLLVAPQGYGKTTLLSDAFNSNLSKARKVAWYTLGPEADEPLHFWGYIADAINEGCPNLPISFTEEIEDVDSFITSLINAIAASGDELHLVLDNFEYAKNDDLLEQLTLLLTNIPSNMRLYLSSATMPHLPLARVQSVASLDVLDPSVLAFTPQECSEYFQASSQFLSDSAVRIIWEETYGWPALVHLVSKSMESRSIRTTVGATAHSGSSATNEYLLQAVFAPMDKKLQEFLILTSVLETLSANGCNYLLANVDSQAMLDELFDEYCVLYALDDQRLSFRCVPRMRQALLTMLVTEDPELFIALHERALDYCEERGLRIESVKHLFALQRYEEAVGIIAEETSSLIGKLDYSAILSMFEQVPRDILLYHDTLFSLYVALCFYTGQMERAAGIMDLGKNSFLMPVVETGMPKSPLSEHSNVSKEIISTCVDVITRPENMDVESACFAIEAYFDATEITDPTIRSFIEYCLAYGYEYLGNYERAINWFNQMEKDNPSNGILARGEVARLRRAQGRLAEALRLYQSITSEIESANLDRFLETWYRLRTMEVLIELWRVEDAEQILMSAEQAIVIQNTRNYGLVTSSECFALLAYGFLFFDLEKAQSYLQRAEKDHASQGIRYPMPIDETRAYLWARSGNQIALSTWAKKTLRRLDEGEPTYVSTMTALSLAFLNLGRPKLAIKVAEHAEETATHNKMPTFIAQALFLKAIGLNMIGQTEDSLANGKLAVEAAQNAQCTGGIPLTGMLGRRLLSMMVKQENAITLRLTPQLRAYAEMLISAIDQQSKIEILLDEPAAHGGSVFRGYADLTDKERSVLALLTEKLTLKAISEELHLSVNTVKTHVKAIYRKLGVHSRKELLSLSGD